MTNKDKNIGGIKSIIKLCIIGGFVILALRYLLAITPVPVMAVILGVIGGVGLAIALVVLILWLTFK